MVTHGEAGLGQGNGAAAGGTALPTGATPLLDIVPDGRRRRLRRRWRPAGTALVATGLVLAGVAAGVAVRGGLGGPRDVGGRAVVRDVVATAPPEATHNRGIGQDLLVRRPDGSLVLAFPTPDGLQIVTDHGNHGRAWTAPVVVPAIRGNSMSVAFGDGHLHVVFSDGSGVRYAVVEERDGQWIARSMVELDTATTTSYVDVAYDGESKVAHVVWVEEGPRGQAPRWAAVAAVDDGHRVLQNARLGPPAPDVPVLVNVATGAGRVLTTYRRGDSPSGWFARPVTGGRDELTRGEPESVPTDAGIGAAALSIDRSGAAHLVLRGSTALLYFTRAPDGGWSPAETVVETQSTGEVNLPSVTVDRYSRLVYVFFQDERPQPRAGVQVAVRDPVTGWQPPEQAADATAAGAYFPTSISQAVGVPLVAWTTGGPSPMIQAAVTPP